MADLPERRAEFVRQYLIDLNATQAAIRAGYAPESADVEGARLLGNANVQEEIQKALKRRSSRTEISQDRVLKELARIAFASMGSFATWGPNGIKLRSKKKLSADDRAAIAELSQTTTAHGGSIRFKLHDKLGALEKLMRHLGMGKERSTIEEFLIEIAAIDPAAAEALRGYFGDKSTKRNQRREVGDDDGE